MRTKAELEEEILYLSHRVAALEGAVTAYRYALEQRDTAQPVYPPPSTWPGLGQMQWYPDMGMGINPTFPNVTS